MWERAQPANAECASNQSTRRFAGWARSHNREPLNPR